MDNLEEEKFTVTIDGNDVECDVLFTFTSDDTGKGYVGFTDHSVTGGKENIYVKSFNPIVGLDSLEDIVDSKEMDMIQGVLMDIQNEYGGDMNG